MMIIRLILAINVVDILPVMDKQLVSFHLRNMLHVKPYLSKCMYIRIKNPNNKCKCK